MDEASLETWECEEYELSERFQSLFMLKEQSINWLF